MLTKADTINQGEKHQALESVFAVITKRKKTSIMPFVHVVSSKTGEGIEELKWSMAEVASQNWAETTTRHISF